MFTRELFVTVGAGLAALALLPASGEAAKLRYHACDGEKYMLLVGGGPQVKVLRIKMRNRVADGYAPRCLVAEAVASDARSKRPKTLNVYGARWAVGKYTCRYSAGSGYTQARCVHEGKDANTVRFRIMN